MNSSNTRLNTNFIRSQFPTFNDPLCKDWSFFENAGGSYVPKQVIEKLNELKSKLKLITKNRVSNDQRSQKDLPNLVKHDTTPQVHNGA